MEARRGKKERGGDDFTRAMNRGRFTLFSIHLLPELIPSFHFFIAKNIFVIEKHRLAPPAAGYK